MKTKNSSNAPRDQTPGDIRYCNYTIEFPDGETWSDYTHIAGGLESWIKRTALYKMNREAAIKLMQKGEYAWYVSHGRMGRVRHRMQISEEKCERKWGLNSKIKIVSSGPGR